MNPPVTTQFANPDPNAAPLNITELVQLLNMLVSSEIEGSYVPYVMGSSTPGVNDRDKAWIKLDAAGRPLGTFVFYNGFWRRLYNGMLGEIRMFSGNPNDTNEWDTNGKGKIGMTYDGWQICNGKNGSPNLTDKFIVGAHMDNSSGHVGYSGGWQTFVDGKTDLKTGGVKEITLNANNTYRPARQAVTADKWSADGNAHSNSGQLYGLGPNDNVTLLAADAGNTTPDPISNLPPFIALGFIIFQGYA